VVNSASRLTPGTAAIPGLAGLPEDMCLDTMFQALARQFLKGTTAVRDAKIVLFHRPPVRWRWPH